MNSIYWVTSTWRSGETVRTGYLTLDAAQAAVRAGSVVAVHAEISEGPLPAIPGAIRDGARVVMDLHRGGHEDDDGITTGGDWIEGVRGVARVSVYGADGTPHGVIEDDAGRLIQGGLVLIEGVDGFPVRNLRTVV